MYYIMVSVTDITDPIVSGVKGVVSEVENVLSGGGKRHRKKSHKKMRKIHKKRHVHTRRCKHHKKSHKKHRRGGSLIAKALLPFGLLKLQKMMQTRKARKSVRKVGKTVRKDIRKVRRTLRRR